MSAKRKRRREPTEDEDLTTILEMGRRMNARGRESVALAEAKAALCRREAAFQDELAAEAEAGLAIWQRRQRRLEAQQKAQQKAAKQAGWWSVTREQVLGRKPRKARKKGGR